MNRRAFMGSLALGGTSGPSNQGFPSARAPRFEDGVRQEPSIQRRTFMALVSGGLLAAPLAAEAQPARRVYRVGFILVVSPVSEMVGAEPTQPAAKGLMRGLQALGYVEGQNLILERRSAEGRLHRVADIARELVGKHVDVIVTTDKVVREIRRVAETMPIVMGISADPVGSGLVESLARPGGNLTGLTGDAGPELPGKQLELLKQALPKVRRVVFLSSRRECEGVWGQGARKAAPTLGVTLIHVESMPDDYSHALPMVAQKHADALLAGTEPELFTHRKRIAEFAIQNRLPLVGWGRDFTEAGALLSYGVSVGDLFRRAATYVDKILKGAKPSDLPIEQPTKFEMVINLKTAKALKLTIPPSLLLRADEVIQ